MILEHLEASGSNEVLQKQKVGSMSKGHRSNLKKLSVSKPVTV